MNDKVERYEAALTDIANADGGEANVMSSLRWIEGYQEGVKTQAQRARAALDDAAPPEYPANLLLMIIDRYKVALSFYADKYKYTVWLNDQDAEVMYDGGERARKALGENL